MRQFALRQFAGGTGSGVITPPDLSDGNLSSFEASEVAALDSYYVQHGVNAEYFRKQTGLKTWVKVVIVDRRETEQSDNQRIVNVEMLTVLIRRYNGVSLPAEGDRISVPALGGVIRTYTLTQRPVISSGQLEWEAEFSRTAGSRQGGLNAVLRGS